MDWEQFDQRDRLARDREATKRNEGHKNRETRTDISESNNRAKREIAETRARSSYDITTLNAEHSIEQMREAVRLAPEYSANRIDEYIKTENVRLQSLEAELLIRGEAASRSAVSSATIDIAQRNDDSRATKQKHQMELERMSHENALAMNRDTHLDQLSKGHSLGISESPVITPADLEAASKRVREQNGDLGRGDINESERKIDDFISKAQKL